MHPILLVTGPPCSGKSTVSNLLALRLPRGVHIESDQFYSFVSHSASPYRVGADEQNAAVIRASVVAAASFAKSGYQVVLDGVIGSWFLPLVAQSLNGLQVPFDIAALEVELPAALSRLRARSIGSEEMVATMHTAFAGHPLPAAYRVATTGRTPEELVLEVERLRSTGSLRWSSPPSAETAA